VTLDEEKVLQQKTKITWLKDGDFNISYFPKVVKGIMSQNRIKDVVYKFEDANSLFTKRLDYDVALDLIKPVDDKEIKEVLFSIYDNKASGPNGYSSKFFKATWSVVGLVFCYQGVFFVKGKLLGEFNTTLISLVPKVKSLLESLIIDISLVVMWFIRNCASKVDILKAYDTVSWSFLEFCLRKFGFHRIMVNWIMTCLTTASFSLCINGESHGFLKAKTGLRQGDLISPYLFTLVMKVLNLMIKRHVKKDNSLYPSMSKSEAFFCGLTPEIKNDILMAMPFKKGTLPIKYLAVPLVSQKISVNDFKILIDVILNRINDWKNRNLSFAAFKLGDDIMRFVNIKIGNGQKCNIWECEGIFNEVLDVLVPNIVNDFEDKVVWIDKKGREKRFSVAEAWKAIKVEFPKVIWHKQGWYSQCIPRHAFIAWVAIKGRLKTKDRLSKWFLCKT
nr:hypothetical protein [Tanacetum cinerariifolium]